MLLGPSANVSTRPKDGHSGEILRTVVVEGRRDLPSEHQEKHPPWGSMMTGVGNETETKMEERIQGSRFLCPCCGTLVVTCFKLLISSKHIQYCPRVVSFARPVVTAVESELGFENRMGHGSRVPSFRFRHIVHGVNGVISASFIATTWRLSFSERRNA